MSFHYTVCVSTKLRRDLASVDVALLDYLFNARGERPDVEPGDALRSDALAMMPLRPYPGRGPDYTSTSLVDFSRRPDGSIVSSQLFLFVPGIKLESVFGQWLSLLRWLSSLIAVDGHFATAVLEDGGYRVPFLFYGLEGRLFMNSGLEIRTVFSPDVNEERELPAR